MSQLSIIPESPRELFDFQPKQLEICLPSERKMSRFLAYRRSLVLSRYLDLPRKKVSNMLYQLEQCYQTSNIRECLRMIDALDAFPGYPFMAERDFFEHMHHAQSFLQSLNKNILPKIPLIAFQKTASSFISVLLCDLFETLPTTISFHHRVGVKSWVNAFGKWGGFNHDHYFPCADNLRLLYDAGIKKCILHNRKPLDVLVSLAHHYWQNKLANVSENDYREIVSMYINRHMESQLRFHGTWYRLWRQEAEQGRIEIVETNYEEMKKDQVAFFQKLLKIYNVPYSAKRLELILNQLKEKRDNKKYNFRKGASNEWQEILTSAQIERAKYLLDKEFNGTPLSIL